MSYKLCLLRNLPILSILAKLPVLARNWDVCRTESISDDELHGRLFCAHLRDGRACGGPRFRQIAEIVEWNAGDYIGKEFLSCAVHSCESEVTRLRANFLRLNRVIHSGGTHNEVHVSEALQHIGILSERIVFQTNWEFCCAIWMLDLRVVQEQEMFTSIERIRHIQPRIAQRCMKEFLKIIINIPKSILKLLVFQFNN